MCFISGHLYGMEGAGQLSGGGEPMPYLCTDYCSRLYSACGSVSLAWPPGHSLFVNTSTVADAALPLNAYFGTADAFCSHFASDSLYLCYKSARLSLPSVF
jgi:hypothetical protein